MAGRGHQDILASDIDWRPGTSPGVSFAGFRLDEERLDRPFVVLSRFASGSTVAPHTHDANYFEYIIEGEQTVGKTTFRAGDVRVVRGGTGYGPITVGPDGCTVLIVFETVTGAMTVPLPRKRA